MANVAAAVAARVISENREAIINAFGLTSMYCCDGLPLVMKIIARIDPERLEELVASVDPSTAERQWARRLRGKAEECRATGASR